MRIFNRRRFPCAAAAVFIVAAGLWVARTAKADDTAAAAERMPEMMVVVHGGAGSPSAEVEAEIAAAREAWEALKAGATALEAAVAGAAAMEDDPQTNAGTGSNIRLDGETVQMDAAVMNERGDFGAVAVIEGVKNPVRVARAVMDSPHLMLAGEGATAFARKLGMPPYDPRTPESRARYEHLRAQMATGRLGDGWEDFDWKTYWNFPRPLDGVTPPSDTIGVVVSDGRGGWAAAVSTGGTSTTLYGRVGDVPLPGAGSFAGSGGAVCATGWGEYIAREMLSRRVYDWMREGISVREAVRRGVALFPREIGVGLIAVDGKDFGVAANSPMAWAAIVGGQEFTSADPAGAEN